jgi:hypothetical protein
MWSDHERGRRLAICDQLNSISNESTGAISERSCAIKRATQLIERHVCDACTVAHNESPVVVGANAVRAIERRWHAKDERVAAWNVDRAHLEAMNPWLDACVQYLSDSSHGCIRRLSDNWRYGPGAPILLVNAIDKVPSVGVGQGGNVLAELVLILV